MMAGGQGWLANDLWIYVNLKPCYVYESVSVYEPGYYSGCKTDVPTVYTHTVLTLLLDDRYTMT